MTTAFLNVKLSPAQFETLRVQAFRAAPPQVMDVPELALFLGVSEDLVRAKTAEGVIPHKSIGRRIVYCLATINHWLARGGKV